MPDLHSGEVGHSLFSPVVGEILSPVADHATQSVMTNNPPIYSPSLPRPNSQPPDVALEVYGRPTLTRRRIEQEPIADLTDAELEYAECYDAAEAYRSPAYGVQAVFDAHSAHGESLVLVFQAGPVACVVADPGPLYGPGAAPPSRRFRKRRGA